MSNNQQDNTGGNQNGHPQAPPDVAGGNQNGHPQAPPDVAGGNQNDHPQAPPDVASCWTKVLQWLASCWTKVLQWLTHEDESKWLEDMRGMLILVATVIATMTFQVAMNPPGGIFQANAGVSPKKPESCEIDNHPCAGNAVAAVLYPQYYHRFQIYNTICFVASLSVSLLLISGIPLNHRFPIWILSIGMIITLSFLALTYLSGMLLVTPPIKSTWGSFRRIYKRTIQTWIGLVAMVGLFLTIKFLVWVCQ